MGEARTCLPGCPFLRTCPATATDKPPRGHWLGMGRSYLERLHAVRHPLTLLAVFQAFDVLSTHLALGQGAQEGNPLVAFGLRSAGPVAIVVAKQAALALAFVAVALDPMDKPYLMASLVTMDILYGAAIAGNFLAYMEYSGEWALPVAYWALALAIATVAVQSRWFPRPSRFEL